MIYLKRITLPTEDQEWHFSVLGVSDNNRGNIIASKETLRRCYSSRYPFGVLSRNKLTNVVFSDVTILCGSNGCGKSTLLNIIANKLKLRRVTPYNRSVFYEDYLKFCDVSIALDEEDYKLDLENCSRIITSDDVFDFMLQLRIKNEELDLKRKQVLQRHAKYNYGLIMKPASVDFDDQKSIDKYKEWSEMTRNTGSRYVRENLGFNEREYSNGESGYQFFVDAIQPNGLYLLDEPENSLAADLQIELAKYIPGMAKHFNCQFIISTHSPFLLAIPRAKIYDLDQNPVKVQAWTKLHNVQLFHNFFKEHESEFER